jgi:hypothetical protein
MAVSEAPEVTLDRALAANRPTLAFFHSLTCDSCIEMTAIVQQVYPEFQGTITLATAARASAAWPRPAEVAALRRC